MGKLTREQALIMSGYVPLSADDVYSSGGGIHIKPSHKGMFTEYKQRTGKTTEEALHSPDPHVRQMANFAKNAASWKHQEGGVAQGDQGNDQMMQMIQTYAQMVAEQSGDDPNKVYEGLMQQLQQMKPEQQQAAMQEIVKQVQTVSQQPAMQMGGDPSQMQQAPQEQQQGGDAEQLMQQVQQMLEQGAQPEEVIAQLLQLQIDPQMVVQIFVQLGMPQEQVVQAVQGVMQQMGGGQEEENPQEQMQEQGMEEPMQQGMEYGGIAKYPYGGMYANKKYYGDFLPQDALNNVMTDINMLAGPTAAMANIKPLKGLAAATGIASGLAGAFQGYRGAANAVFGNKNKPDDKITSYSVTGNIPSTYDAMHSSPRVGPQRFEDLPEEEQKKYPQPVNNNTNIGIPNTRNQWGAPSPNYMNQRYTTMADGGELPYAQYGIPPGFDFNDPYGLQQPGFGQTQNYANTRGYTNGQPIRRPSYSTPGIMEGMGRGQEGYGGADNSRYNNNDPNAPTAGGIKLYNDQQALGVAGQNTISLTDEQAANKKGMYNGYAFPQNVSETNQPKTNNKTIRNISGRQMANNALLGLSAANYALGPGGPRAMSAAQVNQQREASMLNNPLNYAGIYTPNVQGGGNDYIPNRYTPIQNYGTRGNVIAKAGGQMNFAAGGQYKVSHDELLQLLRDGAEIEFL